jgi:hypothetical protein
MTQVAGDCRRTDCPLQPQRVAVPLATEARRMLADAYAEQSRSDFLMYDVVLKDTEECHRLHYLQMACEKIAKAYRLRDTQSFSQEDLYSHVVFSKFITNYLKSPGIKRRYHQQESRRRQIERYAHTLSVEIETLAPAVARDITPANAEYPWLIGETVSVPCRHHYPVWTRLAEPVGKEFLKLIEIAIEDYQSITLNG